MSLRLASAYPIFFLTSPNNETKSAAFPATKWCGDQFLDPSECVRSKAKKRRNLDKGTFVGSCLISDN
jgi:hypothetical protein